jgi:hypothetical protein
VLDKPDIEILRRRPDRVSITDAVKYLADFGPSRRRSSRQSSRDCLKSWLATVAVDFRYLIQPCDSRVGAITPQCPPHSRRGARPHGRPSWAFTSWRGAAGATVRRADESDYAEQQDLGLNSPSRTRRCALKLKQLVAMAVVSGGLGLSAVGLGIGMAHLGVGMAHAVPTSPSPAPTRPSKPPGHDRQPGGDPLPLPLGPLIPDT